MFIQSTKRIVYYPAPPGRMTNRLDGSRRVRYLRTAVVVDRKRLTLTLS
jgi:hypothetical protein